MINLLMPVAGLAQRFIDVGFELPKPLISVAGTPMIKLAMESILKGESPETVRLIFVDHRINYSIDVALRDLFPEYEVRVATVDHVTQGTLCSCLIARDLIPIDEPLIIYTPDVWYQADFTPSEFAASGLDGILLTFKANSPAHSYVTVDGMGLATKTAEKVVISQDALVGVYGYRSGGDFLKYADQAIASGFTVKGEFYVAPMYNHLIADGLKVGVRRTDKMHVLGTPEDLKFYMQHVVRLHGPITIALCCDHSGFDLKERIAYELRELGVEYTDFGSYSNVDSDHYDSLKPCVEHVLATHNCIGIGVCHTGQGFNIAANKVAGIRAALVHDCYTVEMGRRHNAANFFALPARNSFEQLDDMLRMMTSQSFDGGRHATRIRRIANDPLFII
jgi:RpiB/LacA/LacB family sugar-phosphate isomerase